MESCEQLIAFHVRTPAGNWYGQDANMNRLARSKGYVLLARSQRRQHDDMPGALTGRWLPGNDHCLVRGSDWGLEEFS